MKAIIYTKYGSPDNVLELKEVEKPIPSDDQVLIKVQAASLNHTDWYLVTGEPYIVRFWSGFLEPKNKIPGGDIAGRG